MNTTDKTTARAELRVHHQHVATLGAQAETLLRRIGEFQSTAAAAHPAITNLESLRAQRREVLADIALGESDATVLDLADQELEDAEARARIAARGVEIAQAGGERLGREHAALVGQIAAATKLTAALSYHAAVEAAQAAVEPYRFAVAQMGCTYAALLGACLAVENFADPRAVPPRLFVTGELRSTAFGSPLPNLPGFDRAAFDFDYSTQVESATAAALAELAG